MMKHVIYTLLLSFGLLAEGYAQGTAKEPDLFKFVDKQRMDHWVDSVFNSMSDDERIGQLFMVIADLGNNEPNRNKLTGYVRKLHIGGVLFHKGSIYNQARVGLVDAVGRDGPFPEKYDVGSDNRR